MSLLELLPKEILPSIIEFLDNVTLLKCITLNKTISALIVKEIKKRCTCPLTGYKHCYFLSPRTPHVDCYSLCMKCKKPVCSLVTIEYQVALQSIISQQPQWRSCCVPCFREIPLKELTFFNIADLQFILHVPPESGMRHICTGMDHKNLIAWYFGKYFEGCDHLVHIPGFYCC